MEERVLYHRISLRAFAESLEGAAGANPVITLRAWELAHAEPEAEVDYGLSLLREAISLYEARNGVPGERSKAAMPFFRQDTRMLVGPEVGMFVVALSEKPSEMGGGAGPFLRLELDYAALGEHCLLENYSLISCKYNKEETLERLVSRLGKEYDTFFFDEEHTGFTPSSGFFNLLCDACLEPRRPERVGEGEWRLALLRPYEDAAYRFEEGDLLPYMKVELPLECVRRIYLEDYERRPLLFGSLNGFLKSKGLSAERLLNLS